ncbi:substrate-binding and VWA domain-containing protein [Actinokineospora auranticolor]|uniref:substrate-binding and VWA domain-containing protein n=1 Tax=Actinokineospora auranticolor TaxID=155976 RepID=UPI001FE9DE98|nr:substrate-binding and VWA domain-containing protein [Actinokineospora auranticolor]
MLLALVVGGWFALDTLRNRETTASCEVEVLRVVAAPDIAPVVEAVGKLSTDACHRIEVDAKPSSAAVESLAVTDASQAPDVWIPESSLWLRRAQERGAWPNDVSGSSIASSPVVLAMTEDLAKSLGWPDAAPTWAAALSRDVAAGIADPTKDPIGLSALIGIRAATATAADPGAASTTAMRHLSPNTMPQASDLFTRLPGTSSTAGPINAFPASENSVLRYNAGNPPFGLVAAYADTPSLDYPYAILPTVSDTLRPLADRFLDQLHKPETLSSMADAGFRAPDGSFAGTRAADNRTSTQALNSIPLPTPDEAVQVLTQWAGVNLSARMQILLDVSGSMAEPVPGTGMDRMALTIQAAEHGIGMFRPTTKFGLWLFATNLDGDKDYRELLPVRPVTEQLNSGAMQKLRDVHAIRGGATGLYDSVLAAYQSARTNWEPGRLNLVVVLTDGKNEDRDGITRDKLLEELGKLQDPKRPLPIVGMGIGPDVDTAELEAIARPTGGQVYSTPDPGKVGEIFYQALSKLLCPPQSCRK